MSNSALDTVAQANPAQFEHPTCVFLRDYWESKRAGRAMPSRSDISPAQLKNHLGWVMILDVLPGERDFRYRLIGTLVTQYFSGDATGQTVMRRSPTTAKRSQKPSTAFIARSSATRS